MGDGMIAIVAFSEHLGVNTVETKSAMEPRQLRTIFLYEFKLGNSATTAVKNINKAFGRGTASERAIRRWFARFRSGDTSLQNEPRGHRPSAIDPAELKDVIEADPRQTVREVAQKLNVHYSTVSRHLAIIGKVRKLDKWVPHELTDQNKLKRVEVCSSLLNRSQHDRILQRIVTVDEKWILYDNRRRSAQWLGVKEAPGRTPKPPLHPKKVMLTVWWSSAGIIHHSFLPRGQTITADRYCADMRQMHEKLCIKQPALVNRHGVLLLQDNARPHIALTTMQQINHLGYETVPHPPYSPDLSPTDFHLFRHLDMFLSEKRFTNDASIYQAVEDFITSRDADFFKRGINNLSTRWQQCIDAVGDYFD